MMRTYQTRLRLEPAETALLDAYGALYGKVERTLFAALARGEELGKIKPATCARFGLTARQFNALSNSVKAKAKSLVEVQKLRRVDLLERIQGLAAKLPTWKGNKLHQKTRRLGILRQRLAALEDDLAAGRLRLCFGGRKLFQAQHQLETNGFQDVAAWRQAWQAARSDEVFVLGSKDEKAGCQSCQLASLGGGRFQLRLRLPHALADQGRHLVSEVRFALGGEALEAALATRTALSFRFLRDAKGWRLFASTEVQGGPALALAAGALGVDLNEDHLALTETDASGNPVATHRIDLVTYGCSQAQAKARIGEASKQVLALARAAGKPLVVEKLDFSRKKRELKEAGVRMARMLSSLSYARILETIKARAFDAGLPVHEVNPAYSSVVGRHKFAARYGLSNHGAAALVIARRLCQFSERPNRSGGHGTSPAPAWKRGEHAWRYWGRVLGGKRRMQRSSGRRTAAIPAVTGSRGQPRSQAAAGIQSGGAGGSPARESVSKTVREAYLAGYDKTLEF